MKIESVDFFYLSMPEVLDIGDGSQDALLVRVCAGGHTGWGECEAAPLVSIASLVCPMSHSACKPVAASVLGQRLDSVDDIVRIGNLVREQSLDLLQADHTLSGIDMALWDLLGRRYETPVYRLLGYDDGLPQDALCLAAVRRHAAGNLRQGPRVAQQGYRAVKFGWGPFGKGDVQADIDQVVAAREGIGTDGILLIDAGTVWVDDVAHASSACPCCSSAGRPGWRSRLSSGAHGLSHAGDARRTREDWPAARAATTTSWPNTCSTTPGLVTSRSTPGASAASRSPSAWPTPLRPAASPTSTTRSRRTWRCPRRCSPMRDCATT